MKLFDRQKKQEINLYAYYDHAGIVRHLEDMARQGWQLEKAGSVFWTYRRCKPAELRYAVVYFPKASQFDPEPPAEQREFWELCKATGWELVTNRYQMQIFRNPAPDAIPIETDPVVQVENVRAAMKKGSARANWCLLATSLLQLWLQSRSVYTIRDLLLSTFTLLAILIWLMLGIKAVMELIGYYRWCRKARTAAKEEGVLLSPRTRKWWQILQILGFLVTVALALSLPLLSPSHNPSTLITLAAVLAYTLLLTLIVNGSECEPYLTSDHRIMVENAEQIVDGIALAMKASGVACAKVGIEDNKPDAIAAMREAASGKQNIEVVSLPARYPQGFEKTLIYSLTGRIVPNGKLPSAAKCVVMNVGTCAALSAAVRKGQPLIDRVVTVTGRVANPANFRVRIGAPLLDLIDQAGGLTEGVRKLVVGGAMMGNAVPTLNLPITKNFGGFLALGEEAISAEESACIRCGRCMRACPMKLMPAKIDALVRHGDYDGAIAAGAMNCMECGSCTFACPAKRELTQSCRVAKAIARTKAKKS